METTFPIDLQSLATTTGLSIRQVEQTVELLDDGNTVPFITRYRKDQTGGLDEQQVRLLQTKLAFARQLAERKQAILKSIQTQGKLTDRLAKRIGKADSTKRLEDLYLPFKPKKKTLAEQARQRGLEPLAQEIVAGDDAANDLDQRAQEFLSEEHQLATVADVLTGVRHLIAEQFSEHIELRDKLRKSLWKTGRLVCSKAAGVDAELNDVPAAAAPPPPEEAQPVSQPTPTTVIVEVAPPPDDAEQAETTPPDAPVDPVVTEATAPNENAVDPARAEIREKRRAARKTKKDIKRQKLIASVKDYFSYDESLTKIPHHRTLAINRGEKSRVLRVKLACDTAELSGICDAASFAADHSQAAFLKQAADDALHRLLLPSLEREIRREMTEAAEQHAVDCFVVNLRKLLLQPPVRNRRVLAIDPGFKSGCKLAVVDEFGTPLAHDVMYIIGKDEQAVAARAKLVKLIDEHRIATIAIGNGTASRDTEQLVSSMLETELVGRDLTYVMVNEAGASVYSTSELGREEMPDLDPVYRSAVSIARRLLDPLSELVKINPSNMGVGMYQHDLKAKHLRESLDAVVESCVNYVGVDVNTASPALLGYVSGLNQLKARRLYDHRKEHGPFKSRECLKAVDNIGEATFVQAAGFLKINDGENPLDATWIHPESYDAANAVLSRLDASVQDLRTERCTNGKVACEEVPQAVDGPKNETTTTDDDVATTPTTETEAPTFAERVKQIDVNEVASELSIGELTLKDILASLARPGRDPRENFAPPVFRRGIMKLDDLTPGMELSGTVLNVVDFGAFVDIGLSDSGLVHISRLSNTFVANPHEVVSVGDTLPLWVLDIDKQRRRVSLTAIAPGTEKQRPQRGKKSAQSQATKPKPQRDTKKPTAQSGKPKYDKRKKQVRTHAGGDSKPRKPRKAKPVKPITPGMEEGKEPMTAFSDLLQFFDKKKGESGSEQ